MTIDFEKFRPRMLGIAYNFCKNRELAEDLVQNTFIKAYNGLDRFESRACVQTWLTAILVRVWLDFTRTQRRRPITYALFELDIAEEHHRGLVDNETPESILMDKVPSEFLENLVEYIGPQDMYLFNAIMEDTPYSEISEELGIPEKTVRTRVFRAREKVKALIV